jgi:integrase
MGVKHRRGRARRSYGTGTIEELPSGLYRARIFISGFPRRKSFSDRTAAKNWLDGQMGERNARADGTFQARGSQPDLKLRDLRSDFLDDLETSGRTERTRKGYRSHADRVVGIWGELRVLEIDGPQLENIVQEMHRRKWSASTIRNRIAALTGMVKLAQRRGWTPARVLPVRRPRTTLASRPNAYAAEEVEALVAAAGIPWQRCAILLGSDAGLRRGEMIRVRRDDLDADKLILTVPVRDAKDRPKSGRARMVPITRELADAIEECATEPESLVVGRAVWNTPDQLTKLLADVWASAGVTGGVRLHRLRHYWASALANDGHATPWELMEWGGWATLAMVQRYYHAPLKVNRGPLSGLDRSQIVQKESTQVAKAAVATGKGSRFRKK